MYQFLYLCKNVFKNKLFNKYMLFSNLFNSFKTNIFQPLKDTLKYTLNDTLYSNSHKALYVIPFIYANFITNAFYIKYSINTLYLINLYNNYDIYLLNILDIVLNIKIKCTELIKYLTSDNKDFILLKAELYHDLYQSNDVTKEFMSIIKDRVDRNFIIKLYSLIHKEFVFNDDIRLKIYFRYNGIEYIQYFPYNNDNYIQYPLYSEDIIQKYRSDNVYPNYINKNTNNGVFYSMFSMESKDIESIVINDNTFNKDSEIYQYFKKIQTPFYDMGILNNCSIKLLWVLTENNIDLNTFKKFQLKYLNMYFDEEKMDLLEHKITFDKADYTSYKYIIVNLKESVSKNNDDLDFSNNVDNVDNLNYSNNGEIVEDELLENKYLISDRMKYVINKIK